MKIPSRDELIKAGLSWRWADALLNPECFFCGTNLPFDEVTKEELPQERMCPRCYEKEEAELY